MKIYEDKNWLYDHYVTRRLGLKEMTKILKERHNIEITVQGLYNYVVKYDLPKLVGKGRNLNAGKPKRLPTAMETKIRQQKIAQRKRIAAQKKAMKKF